MGIIAFLYLLMANLSASLLDDAEGSFRRSQALKEKITSYAASLEGMIALILSNVCLKLLQVQLITMIRLFTVSVCI